MFYLLLRGCHILFQNLTFEHGELPLNMGRERFRGGAWFVITAIPPQAMTFLPAALKFAQLAKHHFLTLTGMSSLLCTQHCLQIQRLRRTTQDHKEFPPQHLYPVAHTKSFAPFPESSSISTFSIESDFQCARSAPRGSWYL